MEQVFDILSNLEVRFFEGLLPKSIDRTPTAVFQVVAKDTNKLLIQVDANYHLQFKVFYQHKGKFYPHPYTLRTQVNRSINNSLIIEQYQKITHDISLYLELKRLQDFEIDDLKRYYEVIDKNVDVNEELHDFHDVYLVLHYKINGQSAQYQCNNGQPIHLPKFSSNPWTHNNTLIRFRYDAENRDGTFPCEMTLRHGNISNLQSYKIVLCLISNTIPARMDYHAIRWVCKLKPRVSRQNVDKENPYCLNSPSGIIVAQVFGPDLKFTPQILHSVNNLNYVRSSFEPPDFRTALDNSDMKDSSSLAIVVIKETNYPNHIKYRREDRDILRYLPFNELEDVNNNSEATDKEIIKRLKTHKEQCSQQLILYNENETYSQAHVRLYVAAYDDNDILLTEAVHPPLRNNKTFEKLHIIRIVQPKHELHANESAFIYCNYDYSKSKSEHVTCPYEFQLVFTQSINTSNETQLLELFDKPHICIPALFVPNCPCLLQFQVPNDPNYDKHRIYIRLRHKQSKDYDPSPIALYDHECWTYYADPTSVLDRILESNLDDFNDSSISNPITPPQNFELQIQPVLPSDHPFYSEDSNHSNVSLNTPDFNSATKKRFLFSNLSSERNNDE